MKRLFVVLFFFLLGYVNAQDWESFSDSIATLSSPRSTDCANMNNCDDNQRLTIPIWL